MFPNQPFDASKCVTLFPQSSSLQVHVSRGQLFNILLLSLLPLFSTERLETERATRPGARLKIILLINTLFFGQKSS